MNRSQLESLERKQEPKANTITSKEVMDLLLVDENQSTTLLYGYTMERDTFHIYLKDGLLHKTIYGHHDVPPGFFTKYTQEHTSSDEMDASSLVPSKRAYPCRTLASFASLIEDRTRKGIICFTSFALKYEDNFLTENNLYIAGKTKEDFFKKGS